MLLKEAILHSHKTLHYYSQKIEFVNKPYFRMKEIRLEKEKKEGENEIKWKGRKKGLEWRGKSNKKRKRKEGYNEKFKLKL